MTPFNGCWRRRRNMYLNKIGRPSIYLPTCMAIWGFISILTGQFSTWAWRSLMSIKKTQEQRRGTLSSFLVIHNLKNFWSFLGAVCTRFFLGFVEAAFFPGALFLLSKWWVLKGRRRLFLALTSLRYKRRELGQRTAILSCGQSLTT